MSSPQIIPNGTGHVIHKIKVPFLKKTYSAWLNAAGELDDCEGRDAKGRTCPVKRGSAEWSAVKVAARQLVKNAQPKA